MLAREGGASPLESVRPPAAVPPPPARMLVAFNTLTLLRVRPALIPGYTRKQSMSAR